MIFLAIFFALLIEQVRPLGAHSGPHQLARLWVAQVLRSCDAGSKGAARLAWGLIVLLPALLVLLAHHLLLAGGNWLAWTCLFALHVGVLYLTLGFRQFSAYFSSIRDALDAGDEDNARSILANWVYITPSPQSQQAMPRSDILRSVLAQASLSAHIHVFGVIVAYSVGALLGLGPAGAVAYRLCELLARTCSHAEKNIPYPLPDKHPISLPMLSLAKTAWRALDWLPARCTAMLYAIVGNFEDAIASWRAQAQAAAATATATAPANENSQIVISAAAGAIGVQMAAANEAAVSSAASSGDLNPPQLGHLQAMVGLVWRSVVVAMTLLALLTIAGTV
jgi:adenosylcobinamide-phosphate synthase